MTRRLVTLLVFIACLGSWSAKAEEPVVPNSEVQAAIQSVIDSQLKAFQRDDGIEAYSYASPAIQQKFSTVDIFMSMVRNGYPAVYRPAYVEFLDARIIAPHTAQAVKFIDGQGQGLIMIYFMEQQPNGSWLIDGVQAVPLEELSS